MLGATTKTFPKVKIKKILDYILGKIQTTKLNERKEKQL